MSSFITIRLCLTFLFSLFLLGPQVIASPALPVETNAVSRKLVKRGILADLWNSVPDTNRVQVKQAKSFSVKTSDTANSVFAPTPFYGCTIVVIVNGHGALIGHFAEVKQGGTGRCLDDQATVNQYIAQLQTAEATGPDFDFEEGTQAWIVYSNDVPSNSVGLKAIRNNLQNELGIDPGSIHDIDYSRGYDSGSDYSKLVIQWAPNAAHTQGTMTVYIQQNTAAFSGVFDSNGNPVNNPGTVTVTVVPVPVSAPTCTYVPNDPPVVNEAYCTCGTQSYPLSDVAGAPVPVTSSCGYTQLPSPLTGSNGIGVYTNTALCQVCTPYAVNGADCTALPNCTPNPVPKIN